VTLFLWIGMDQVHKFPITSNRLEIYIASKKNKHSDPCLLVSAKNAWTCITNGYSKFNAKYSDVTYFKKMQV